MCESRYVRVVPGGQIAAGFDRFLLGWGFFKLFLAYSVECPCQGGPFLLFIYYCLDGLMFRLSGVLGSVR